MGRSQIQVLGSISSTLSEMYFMYLCTLNLQIFSTNNLFSLVREPSTKSRKELFKESINLGEKKIRMTLNTAT